MKIHEAQWEVLEARIIDPGPIDFRNRDGISLSSACEVSTWMKHLEGQVGILLEKETYCHYVHVDSRVGGSAIFSGPGWFIRYKCKGKPC